MSLKSFFASRAAGIVIFGLLGVAVLLLVFRLGVMVGMRRADDTLHWSANYPRVFGGPPSGLMGGMMQPGPGGPHGVFGEVLKTDNGTMVIRSGDHEFSVVLNPRTGFQTPQGPRPVQQIKIGDNLVIIGAPDDQGRIQARFIRLFPTN